MKIAVPFENGQVFQHFGRSAQFKFYEAENGQLLRTEVIPTNGQGHGALTGFLVQHGADVVLCGGIGTGASRYPRDGRFIEEVGYYDPTKEPSVIKIDEEKAKTWLANGAQPTDTVKALLKIQGIVK